MREFLNLPALTRSYVILAVGLSILTTTDVISPYSLYFDHKAVISRHEWWRCFTSFAYFGNIGINSLFALTFVSRYFRMLEEQMFINRTVDFIFFTGWCCVFVMLFVTLNPFKNMDTVFLGYAFGIAFMYYWARSNPEFRFSLCGIFTFSAPYLPWVILLISKVFSGECTSNLIGIIVGHMLFFCEQRLPNYINKNPLRCPKMLKDSFKNFSSYLDKFEAEMQQTN